MRWIYFLLITLSASIVSDELAHEYFVVWNVGQGQWTTAILTKSCIHFDLGGEFFPLKKITRSCNMKKNFFYLSHWDWDHIGGLKKILPPKNLPNRCLALEPLGPTNTKKQNLLAKFDSCISPAIRENELFKWQAELDQNKRNNSNSLSHVISFKKILIPGDSTLQQELKWLSLPWVASSKVLILGHHGSHTSTSIQLLNHMPHLHMAIASARWARYHHPHAQTALKIKNHRTSLLKTDDWGNIWLEI